MNRIGEMGFWLKIALEFGLTEGISLWLHEFGFGVVIACLELMINLILFNSFVIFLIPMKVLTEKINFYVYDGVEFCLLIMLSR